MGTPLPQGLSGGGTHSEETGSPDSGASHLTSNPHSSLAVSVDKLPWKKLTTLSWGRQGGW